MLSTDRINFTLAIFMHDVMEDRQTDEQTDRQTDTRPILYRYPVWTRTAVCNKCVNRKAMFRVLILRQSATVLFLFRYFSVKVPYSR